MDWIHFPCSHKIYGNHYRAIRGVLLQPFMDLSYLDKVGILLLQDNTTSNLAAACPGLVRRIFWNVPQTLNQSSIYGTRWREPFVLNILHSKCQKNLDRYPDSMASHFNRSFDLVIELIKFSELEAALQVIRWTSQYFVHITNNDFRSAGIIFH